MRHLLSSFALLLLLTPAVLAGVRHVPLERRIDDAAIIVEGRVTDSTPFMNPEGTMIYTAHRLHVYKALKLGSEAPEELRTIVLVVLLPKIREVRRVRPISFSRVIFRVTRMHALAGLVFDIVVTRPKQAGKELGADGE